MAPRVNNNRGLTAYQNLRHATGAATVPWGNSGHHHRWPASPGPMPDKFAEHDTIPALIDWIVSNQI